MAKPALWLALVGSVYLIFGDVCVAEVRGECSAAPLDPFPLVCDSTTGLGVISAMSLSPAETFNSSSMEREPSSPKALRTELGSVCKTADLVKQNL